MRSILIALYLVSGVFVFFALHAKTLDAPTLVVQEYTENFLNPSPRAPRTILDPRFVEGGVRTYLSRYMKNVSPQKAVRLSRLIAKLAGRHGLPAGLILSVMRVESDFQPWAVSSQGALGLMQVMPETGEWLAQRYGMKWEGPAMLLDEEMNTLFGVRYLAYLRDKYEGDLQKMLSAYNRGPAKVDEELNEGRSVTSTYYHKIKRNFPKLAFGV